MGRGRKFLHGLDRCAIKSRIARERLLLETIRPYAVEPTAGDLLSTIYKSAEARRERPQAIGDSWRRPRRRRDWRDGNAGGNRTQEDLRPAASGNA